MFERWTFLYLLATIMVILVNYLLLRSRLPYHDTKFQPPFKPSYRLPFYPQLLQCCNPLLCSLEGEWVLRPGVRPQHVLAVEKINKELRYKKGWPTNLYHGDMRCGRKYPLPRVVRTINRKKIYAMDIPSQCSYFSASPCCRDDIGFCGSTPDFCECPTCTNYGRLRYAELLTWVPKNNCGVTKLNSDDTCWFLENQFSSITFIGDSLVRHTFSALLIHLTGDRAYGALKSTQSREALEYCKHESQFVDAACHTKLATKWEDIRSNNNYCKLSRNKVKLSFIQAFTSNHTPLAIAAMKQALRQSRPLFVLGIGIHDQFNVSKVINFYLKPILNVMRIYKHLQPEMIWLNTHAAGPLKPLVFQRTQGNRNILYFNNAVGRFLRSQHVVVFDTFNLTQHVHSFDGTHYGSELNLLKVQLLIHGLLHKNNNFNNNKNNKNNPNNNKNNNNYNNKNSNKRNNNNDDFNKIKKNKDNINQLNSKVNINQLNNNINSNNRIMVDNNNNNQHYKKNNYINSFIHNERDKVQISYMVGKKNPNNDQHNININNNINNNLNQMNRYYNRYNDQYRQLPTKGQTLQRG